MDFSLAIKKYLKKILSSRNLKGPGLYSPEKGSKIQLGLDFGMGNC
jgi:hypothetical protein